MAIYSGDLKFILTYTHFPFYQEGLKVSVMASVNFMLASLFSFFKIFIMKITSFRLLEIELDNTLCLYTCCFAES